MRYKGVIFDLDGTLSDSVPCILKCSSIVHEKMGIPWDEEVQRKDIGRPLYQVAADLVEEDRIQEYLDTTRKVNEEYLGRLIQPFDGVIELLSKLKESGLKMCIVTSRLKWGADLSAEKIGAAPFMEKVIAIEDTKTHKPDPEPAFLALSVMGLKAEDVVFVGDSPFDINCGKNAGMDSVGVGWGVTPDEILKSENPTHFCKTIAELEKVLLG